MDRWRSQPAKRSETEQHRSPSEAWPATYSRLGRAKQINAVVLLAAVKQLSVNIVRIDDVLLRQQVFVLQGLMNDGGPGIIGDGSTGRFDMRDQVRALLLARFGQMDGCHPPNSCCASCCNGRPDRRGS